MEAGKLESVGGPRIQQATLPPRVPVVRPDPTKASAVYWEGTTANKNHNFQLYLSDAHLRLLTRSRTVISVRTRGARLGAAAVSELPSASARLPRGPSTLPSLGEGPATLGTIREGLAEPPS